MLDTCKNIWTQLNDPARIGAVVDDLPQISGLVGVFLVVVLLLSGMKSHAIRWSAAVIFAGGAVLYFQQRGSAPVEGVPTWASHLPWVAAGLTSLLLAISATKSAAIRSAAVVLAFVISLSTSGLIGYTMHQLQAGPTLHTEPATPPGHRDPLPEPVRRTDPSPAPADPTRPEEPADGGGSIFDFGRE